jgi:hypothetical protein
MRFESKPFNTMKINHHLISSDIKIAILIHALMICDESLALVLPNYKAAFMYFKGLTHCTVMHWIYIG